MYSKKSSFQTFTCFSNIFISRFIFPFYNIFYYLFYTMDSIAQRQEIFTSFDKVESFPIFSLKPRDNSPESEKKKMIEKITFYTNQKDQLQVKQQSLQSNVSDLRKLLEAAGTENKEYMQNIEEEIMELSNKALRLSSALKYSHKNGNHLRNCALFWKQFVQ